MQARLLGDRLDAERHVLVVGSELRLRHAGWPEPLQILLRQRSELQLVSEPSQVDPEQAIGGELDEVAERRNVPAGAVGGQAHHLALVGVGMEPQPAGDGGVDLA